MVIVAVLDAVKKSWVSLAKKSMRQYIDIHIDAHGNRYL
jgi:hypothetical protein